MSYVIVFFYTFFNSLLFPLSLPVEEAVGAITHCIFSNKGRHLDPFICWLIILSHVNKGEKIVAGIIAQIWPVSCQAVC